MRSLSPAWVRVRSKTRTTKKPLLMMRKTRFRVTIMRLRKRRLTSSKRSMTTTLVRTMAMMNRSSNLKETMRMLRIKWPMATLR